MAATTTPDIRQALLDVIQEQSPRDPREGSLQMGSVLSEVARRIDANRDLNIEQALLTQISDLFRTGFLAWGYNVSNPNPPFFHVTAQGRSLLANLSRDPGNPGGYLSHLLANAALGDVARSYIEEGLACYVGGTFKAAAVMVGAAAECLALDLRDALVSALTKLGKPVPTQLNAWQVKTVLDSLYAVLAGEKKNFQKDLREEFEGYWSAFTQQARAVRNDAGHPTSVDPVTPQSVQAAFLIYPELARLQSNLSAWIQKEFK